MSRVTYGAEAGMAATNPPADLHHHKDGTRACEGMARTASCLRTRGRPRRFTVQAHSTLTMALWAHNVLTRTWGAQNAHLHLGGVNYKPWGDESGECRKTRPPRDRWARKDLTQATVLHRFCAHAALGEQTVPTAFRREGMT